MVVNLIIPLHKENGIAKNMHSDIFLVFLFTLGVPVSSRRGANICMHAYSIALSINVHLRLQLAVIYAIAESKTVIWSFWEFHLKFSRFTRTLLLHNFRGMSFAFWYANVHL